MVPIKDFSRVINYSQSLNVRFTITINSYAHLNYMYNEEEANLLKFCFGNIIYLLSEDIKTLEEVSKYCGTTKDGSLITVEELKALSSFEAIINMMRLMPIKASLIPDYKINWGYEDKIEEIPIRKTIDVKIFEK